MFLCSVVYVNVCSVCAGSCVYLMKMLVLECIRWSEVMMRVWLVRICGDVC